MQEAEVAGAAVTFGQDVLQDQVQECRAAERAGFHLAGLAVLITERDVTLVTGQNVFLLVHAPIRKVYAVFRLVGCSELEVEPFWYQFC